MYFITNHFPTGSQRSKLGRPFVFDEKNNNVSMTFYCCEYDPSGRHTEVMSRNLFRLLAAQGCRQVLLYIHGFNTQPERALARGLELQALFDQADPGAVAVVPMVWPNGNKAGIIRDYDNDQERADCSGFAFSRALESFALWSSDQDNICPIRLNVLAHSMGNRVLREALLRWRKGFGGGAVPLLFQHVFMAAADVVNETLCTGQSGEVIRHAGSTVTVYHAATDLVLRGSKAINVGNGLASRRMGHTGPLPFENDMQNVVSVDCTDFAQDYEPLMGHNYFALDEDNTPGALFEHMLECMESGRATLAGVSRNYILGGDGGKRLA